MKAQHGISLVLSLLLLAALSLLGLAAAGDSQLQRRVTQNQVQAGHARQSADSALAWAEAWLLSLPGDQRPQPCPSDCTARDVIRTVDYFPPSPEYQPPEWWCLQGQGDGYDPVDGARLDDRSGLHPAPACWIVEEVWLQPAEAGQRPAISYYRIIAAGGDPDSGTAVTESILARPWGDATWADQFPAIPGTRSFCHQLSPQDPCGRLAWRQRR